MATDTSTGRNILPAVSLQYVKGLTSSLGIRQFYEPEGVSIFTLDDNARALVAFCSHYAQTGDEEDIPFINTYFNFIKHCRQPEGYFLNYTDEKGNFTELNNFTNLADANGRAIWALGYLVSLEKIVPAEFSTSATTIIQTVLSRVHSLHSTRAMAFIIKGLCYSNEGRASDENQSLIKALADKLVQMYKHEAEKGWEWFEKYLSYANAVLPHAMLMAYSATGNVLYREIARSSFDFLLSYDPGEKNLAMHRDPSLGEKDDGIPRGERSLEAAYTISALDSFYEVFRAPAYLQKLEEKFVWFTSNEKVVFDPLTGNCCDPETGGRCSAASALAYVSSRLVIDNYIKKELFTDPGKDYRQTQVA